MSGVFGNPWLYNPSDDFFTKSISNSLRFTAAQTPYLTFGQTKTPTDIAKWTVNFWLKRSDPLAASDDYDAVFGVDGPGTTGLAFLSGKLYIFINYEAGGSQAQLVTNRVFRDPSAWYNFHISFDRANSTNAHKVRLYINGVEETDFSTDQRSNITSSSSSGWNVNGLTAAINRRSGGVSARYHNGYLAQFYNIDGQALDPTSFIEISDGVCKPKAFTGTFGNQGWLLEFKESGVGTGASNTVGADTSGNDNHWSSFNVESIDVVPDSPTNVFATANPLAINTSSPWTTSEGHLKILSSSNNKNIRGNFLMQSGKWYWETRRHNANNSNAQLSDGLGISLASGNLENNPYQSATNWSYYSHQGYKYNNNSGQSYGDTWNDAGDIIGVAFDADNGAIWFSKNGTWQNSATASEIAAGTTTNAAYTGLTDSEGYVCVWWRTGGNNAEELDLNFGQNPSFNGELTGGDVGTNTDSNSVGLFKYPPPNDFLSLCTKNLASPSIGPQADSLATDHFNTLTYTGNTGTLEVDGLNFRPDFLWIKRTDASQNFSNGLLNSVRGNTKGVYSNRTTSEFTSTGTNDLQSFDDDGFTVGQSNQFSGNDNGGTFAAWSWKAGGTAPTKTYRVVVDVDSGQNKYRFRNSTNSATFATYAPTIELQEGGTYVFDWSDDGTNGAVSAQGHPIRFSTTSNGTHGGGTEYTTGVVKDDSAYTTTITVAAGAPTLYYYCQYHSGMGGQVNTNSTFGSTNFNGTLLSVESVNETAGFSILTYSGSLSSSGTASVGHDLGAKPSAIISKSLDNSGADSGEWIIWHDSLPTDNYVLRFDTAAESNKSGNGDMASLFTATTFGTNYTVGSNVTGNNYIAYLFREIPQYSKFGQFTGNSSSDGTFVYTNFRVAFLLVKSTVTGSSWLLYDNKRNGFNVQNRGSYAAGASGQASDDDVDLLSNGFKWRRSSPNFNQSSYSEYIYFAIGDQAYKFSNAR